MIRSLGWLLLLASHAAAAEPWRVTLIEGDELPAAIVAVSADGSSLQIGNRTFPLEDVRWIAPTGAIDSSPPVPSPVRIWLEGGDLAVTQLNVDKEQVRLQRGDIEWTAPLEAIRGAWWGPTTMLPAFAAALAEPHAERDQFLLLVNGTPTVIAGFLEGVSAEQVRLDWMDELRNVARTACLGFITTRPATESQKRRFTVALRDGSRMPADSVQFSDNALSVRVVADRDWSVPWNDVDRIAVVSSRLVFLSDLTPVDVRSEPIVALPRPWRIDRSVTGSPLPTPSRRGLGMQAGTWLTFDVAELKAARLAVDVGLDLATGRTGDCEVVIRGDGRELGRQRLRGGEPAVTMQVDLRDIAHLELGVAPGENLDLGDHVNWCDARLIRPRTAPE